jgi:drug/metabolite transporter (DMT)-like permease
LERTVIETQQTRLRAMACAIIGFAMYALVDSLNKWVTGGYSIVETMFFNAVFAMIPTSLIISAGPGWRAIRVKSWAAQFLRSATGLGTALCSLFAFVRMPLADVYAFIFAAPLVLAAVSALFFRERVGMHRWGAIVVGFLGVIYMLQPDPSGFNIGILGAIGCMACYCVSSLCVRYMGQEDNAFSFAFYGNVFTIVTMGAILPFVYVAPTTQDWMVFALIGLIAGCALPILVEAFIKAPSPVVAPFQYTQMAWGLLFGWVMFGDHPDQRLLIGGVVVIASGLYLFLREARSEPVAVPVPVPEGD